MKLYVSIPEELQSKDILALWNHLEKKLKQEYLGYDIISNYLGNGTLEEAKVVVFLYEFKDTESCKRDMKRCEELGILYNFFTKFYAEDRLYYPSPTQNPFYS